MEKKGFLEYWRQKTRELKTHTLVLYCAYRDPRVPWYAKLFVAAILAYAFSPIDLIPDFIPVLGYLDDLLIIPAGVYLALKMIPPQVLADCREQARESLAGNRPEFRFMGVIVVLIWLLALLLLVVTVARALRG